jgi:hypothetical protein
MKILPTVFWVVVLAAIVGAGYYFLPNYISQTPEQPNVPAAPEAPATTTVREPVETIGTSVEGRAIEAYHFGEGDTELLFVGGIHGGYSWNTALLGFELVDYLQANPAEIPANVSVTVIPVLNPDGLNTIVGTAGRFEAADVPSGPTVAGRFNANEVDLNRNFDCEWESEGTWQSRTVSGGSAAFSEPEAAAVRAYVESNRPAAAVVYYSAAGGVFASSCSDEVLPETLELTNEYADASGYRAYESFDFYAITGDMVNWLAKQNIPAISVLLTNHTDIEWQDNLAGIKALFAHYAN